MNSIFRLTLFFSTILLFIIGIWFVSDHPQSNISYSDENQNFRAAMQKNLAEDFTYTVELFLHQIEEDLLAWEDNTTEESDQFHKKLIREVEQHPHIHGYGKYRDHLKIQQVGEIPAEGEELLTRQSDHGLLLSDPYIKQGTKRVLLGKELGESTIVAEVDLSFIEKFVKDIAALSDSNGQFFIGDGNLDVSATDEEADAPYVKQEIPEIGWSIYVQDKGPDLTEEEHFRDGEAVVELNDNAIAESWAEERGLLIVDKLNSLIIVRDLHRTTEELINYLESDNYVLLVEPNFYYTKQINRRNNGSASSQSNRFSLYERISIPNDEFYEPYQWNLSQINAEEGWNFSVGDERIPIAIIDSGVDPEHVDLAERIEDGYNGFEDNGAFHDEHGHGTHVAGVAAAITNNEDGVAGISWTNPLLAVKVLDQNAEGNSLSIAKGIVWAVDNGAKVINLSLGDSHNSKLMYDAIRYAYNNDVVLIAASGNDNVDTPMYPAAYKEVLAVAAVDPYRERAFFSNYGDHIDVSAPGEHIPSTFPGNQYVVMSGTSMASPHVAGLAGLIRSINPNLTNEEVYDVIRRTSDDLGPRGYDPYYGYGEINIRKALEVIMQD